MFTVFGYEGNPRTKIIRIVAAAEGIPLALKKVIPRENLGRDAYMSHFPLSQGKIPALEGKAMEREVKLFETVAITTYLARINCKNRLLGDGSLEQEAEVLSWVCWANQELLPLLALWFLPLIPNLSRPAPYDYSEIERSKGASLTLLDKVEDLLGQRDTKFLVGDSITLADIFFMIFISRGIEWVLDTSWRDKHPAIMGHFGMVSEWEYTKAIVPNFVQCKTSRANVDPRAAKGANEFWHDSMQSLGI